MVKNSILWMDVRLCYLLNQSFIFGKNVHLYLRVKECPAEPFHKGGDLARTLDSTVEKESSKKFVTKSSI